MHEYEYTVIAVYSDQPQLFCTTVTAATAEEAIEVAWQECRQSNWGADSGDIRRGDCWSDVMVFFGSPEVVG